jgi:tetratricopeptide (TPR) repeat protein
MRALLVLSLAVTAAHADDLRSVARDKFAEGRREFDAKHFERAIVLLKESYALAPYPDLLFNIGRCHEELHQYREALDVYERYLATNPGDPDVSRRVADMRERAADEPWPSPSPAPVPPQETTETTKTTTPPAPIGEPSATTVEKSRPTPLYRKWWLWTAVAGVAVIAVGVGLGVGLSQPAPSRTFPPLSGP